MFPWLYVGMWFYLTHEFCDNWVVICRVKNNSFFTPFTANSSLIFGDIMALVGFSCLKGSLLNKKNGLLSFLSCLRMWSSLVAFGSRLPTKGCLFTKGLESYEYVCRQQESTVARIPDLSVMESVWDYMERQKTLKQPESTEELWHYLQDAEQPTCQVAWKTVQVYQGELVLF